MRELDEKGAPIDKSYLECGLPPLLAHSVAAMQAALDKLERGEEYLHWDCDYCDLQTNINICEGGHLISPEQAWYLRRKYLGAETDDEFFGTDEKE